MDPADINTSEHRLATDTHWRKQRQWTADRFLAVLLMLVQAGVLMYLAGAWLFPLIMVAIAIGGLTTRMRLRLDAMAYKLVYAIIGVAYLLHYLFAPFKVPVDAEFIRTSLSHSIARYLLTLQVIQLFLHHRKDRLPTWIAGACGLALCFATNLRRPVDIHLNLMGMMAAFIALFALYGSQTRRAIRDRGQGRLVRGVVMSVALLVAIALGTGSSWALQKHERNIEWFLSEYLGYGSQRRAGFTPNGRLESASSWKTNGGDIVKLRIFADQQPGYLRGKVFDQYQSSSRENAFTPWADTTPARRIGDVVGRNLPQGRPGDQLYELAPATRVDVRVLDIWPEEREAARIFTPLNARWLAVSGDGVRKNQHGIVTLDDRVHSRPYLVFTTDASPTETFAPTWREQLTSLPTDIDPRVSELAKDLFVDCRTTRDKLDAVQAYFHDNYKYRLGITIPRHRDPVGYFLIEQPAAHCEYFASGTAVLLRLADVPCRYVVGFVANEFNTIGGFWVARNKDAHAWVEAFDEDAGHWTIVESTPSSGLPQPGTQTLGSQLVDSFEHRLSIWRMRIREYGFGGILLSIANAFWSIPGLMVLLGILGIMLVRQRPQFFTFKPREKRRADLKEMHAVLRRLDRQTARHGYERTPDETLSHFAGRLRDVDEQTDWVTATADCYDLYVTLRYRNETGPDAIRQVDSAAKAIPA